jgi:hypothetical protein
MPMVYRRLPGTVNADCALNVDVDVDLNVNLNPTVVVVVDSSGLVPGPLDSAWT